MDAGEIGTFLDGKMLFIDVDDHLHESTSVISSRSGAVDDCFKDLASDLGSEDDAGTPAHPLSNGGGSLSHASFGAAGGETTGSDDEGRVTNKRKRSNNNDLSALCFEVESPSSLVESAMRISSPVAESMVHFSPQPAHLNTAEGSDGGTRYFTVGMGTPLLPPPPNSNGVALGLPINPEIHHLRKQPTILRSSSNSSTGWGCGAGAPLSQMYCKSAFGAPRVSPLSGDLTAALHDVLHGKTSTPPLGLKLNIAAVVSELNLSKLSS
ncbi:hypothetical protein Ndes2526B_g01630 [Nannochloris sp. 'desiccata']|nr:hypothetical protein KSW81_005871 [Chlorella desiccata (nom. nud.)]KAH7623211.1 hypothetical protein NADE_002404 [Chlorella desiccata (nom. nud.)]